MTNCAVSELVKEIKILLDRNQESSVLLPDESDTLSQGELIRSKIEDAAKLILTDAPSTLLEGKSLADPSVTWTSSYGVYVGKVKLPSDLIRILRVKVSDWVRPAKIITENDDEYKLQTCRFGVRGNREKPVAVVVHSGDERCLELYTSTTDDATLELSYVEQPKITGDAILIPDLLVAAVKYMAGYLVCISLGDGETANGLLSVARNLAGIADVEPSQTE